MALKSGTLNHLTKLQKSVRAETQAGGGVYTWQTVDNEVWIGVTPLQGNALMLAKQLEPNISAKIILRYRTDVKLGMRFYEERDDGDVTYLLKQDPRDMEEKQQVLECLCQRVAIS